MLKGPLYQAHCRFIFDSIMYILHSKCGFVQAVEKGFRPTNPVINSIKNQVPTSPKMNIFNLIHKSLYKYTSHAFQPIYILGLKPLQLNIPLREVFSIVFFPLNDNTHKSIKIYNFAPNIRLGKKINLSVDHLT